MNRRRWPWRTIGAACSVSGGTSRETVTPVRCLIFQNQLKKSKRLTPSCGKLGFPEKGHLLFQSRAKDRTMLLRTIVTLVAAFALGTGSLLADPYKARR